MACIEITEGDFDDMHHALGRPDLATLRAGEHDRNYYCVAVGSPWARHAESLGLWTLARVVNSGADAIYTVNEDGRSALADWLSLRSPAA